MLSFPLNSTTAILFFLVSLFIPFIASSLSKNSLARIVVPSTRRFHPITPVLRSLHWPPISSRINYKIASITFKTLQNQQPAYLHDLLTPYVPTRSLRSSDKHLLVVPSTKLVQSRRSFLHAAPTVWNSLPLTLRSTSSYSLFHSSQDSFFSSIAYRLLPLIL